MDSIKSKDFFVNNDNFEKIRDIKSNCLLGDKSLLDNIDLTICIPTYKRENCLKQAIDSALEQQESKLNYCIVVVDNNADETNNNTFKLIQQYNNPNILYFQNEKNIGMFNNFNRCFEIAKSKWCALLHDDDFLKKDYVSCIEKMLPLLNKRQVSCLCFAFDRLYKDVRKNEENNTSSLVKFIYKILIKPFQLKRLTKMDTSLCYIFGGNPFAIPSCGILFDREKVIESGGFDENLFPTADSAFVLYLMQMQSVCYSHHAVGIYRWEYNESLKPEIYMKSVEGQRYETLFLAKKHRVLAKLFNCELMKEKDLLLEHKPFNPGKLLVLFRRILMDTKLHSDAVCIYQQSE